MPLTLEVGTEPVFAQLGLGSDVGAEMTIDDGSLVLRRLVNLDRPVGSEIRKTHLRAVLVAPMTTAGREAPFRIGVTNASPPR
jgi:hypothetical protein